MTTIKTKIAILKAARQLIGDEKCWTRHTAARNADGKSTPSCDATAVCFCSVGACSRAAHNLDLSFDDAYEAGQEVSYLVRGKTKGYFYDIVSFNDNEKNSHSDVLKQFDDTIAKLEQEQAS